MDGHRPCFAYYGDSVNHVTHDQALDSQDCTPNTQGRSQDFEFRGLKPMASAERKPITGVWGRAASGVQGQSPWSGVQGGKAPLKLKAFWSLDVQRSGQILAHFQKCICISTLGATVMIWEKFMSKSRGSRDPPCPFLEAPMVGRPVEAANFPHSMHF